MRRMGGLSWSPVLAERARYNGARPMRAVKDSSPGIMARLGVPLDGRVRKLRAVEAQSGPISGEVRRRVGRNILRVAITGEH